MKKILGVDADIVNCKIMGKFIIIFGVYWYNIGTLWIGY